MTRGRGGMPDLVSPMQVSAGSGVAPTGPDWVVELAWTGHRAVAYVEPGRRTRLLSSGDVSITAAYPELAGPLEDRAPPRGMVLDGTIVARGEEHAVRPRLLQRRSGRFRPSEAQIRDVPVDFQVADLLFLDGHDIMGLPYRERRGLLDGLGFDRAPVWTTSPLPVSELATMLRIADAKGVDVLHARHLGSRYHPGGRSPLWLKVPVPRTRQVVVGGWTPTDPARPDTIAELLLGVPGEAGLRYVGRVGVTGEQRRRVAQLVPRSAVRAPFVGRLPADLTRRAIWVEPDLVAEVEFTGFLASGQLRLPHWRGPVAPADVDEVRWARPAEPPPRRADPGATRADPDGDVGDGGVRSGRDVRSGPGADPGAPAAVGRQAARTPERSAVDRPRAAADVAVPTSVPDGAPVDPDAPVESRRLEQHFVYNSLNTIAALIRTDPARARELLFGFADLSRAADRAGEASTTLGSELETVRGYLQLEQARFGPRLRVELTVDPALHGTPVAPLRLLGAVRVAVQRDIEPRPQGGVLTVTAAPAGQGCVVTVVGGAGDPASIELPASGTAG